MDSFDFSPAATSPAIKAASTACWSTDFLPYPTKRAIEMMNRRQYADQETAMRARTTTAPCVAVRRDDVVPICPHCEADLAEIHLRKLRGAFGIGRGFVFCCPHCRKVVGSGTQWYPFPG